MTVNKTCAGCGVDLVGRQKKWCASLECKKRASRQAWILKVYGLTTEQYQLIIDWQGGVCGLCSKPFKQGQTPHIDHEHGGPCRGIVHPFVIPVSFIV